MKLTGVDGRGNEAHRERDGERDEDEIVYEADHRDGVGDEIDRRERIGDATGDDQSCVPGRAGMAHRERERQELAFDGAGALGEGGENAHVRFCACRVTIIWSASSRRGCTT